MLFLLDLPKGEEVTILAQKKKDGEITDLMLSTELRIRAGRSAA